MMARRRMRKGARYDHLDHLPQGVRDAGFWCDAVQRTSDPTGTIDIRRAFNSALELRWRQVRAAVQKQVVGSDVLALKPDTVSPLASGGSRELGFQTWFDALLKRVVVDDGSWMRTYMQAAYNRALKRAMRLTQTNIIPKDQSETVNALTTLCYTELQGIAEAVSQRVMRAATQAWLHNENPAQAFKEMDAAFSAVAKPRGSAMAELMVVKSFNTGTLDQFEAVGVKAVGLIAETKPGKIPFRKDAKTGPGSRGSREESPSASTIGRIRAVGKELEKAFGAEGDEEQDPNVNVATAGDELVCPICEDIEADNPYTLDEARSLIPAHPNCRCAFVPDESEKGFFGKVFGAIKSFFGGLFE